MCVDLQFLSFKKKKNSKQNPMKFSCNELFLLYLSSMSRIHNAPPIFGVHLRNSLIRFHGCAIENSSVFSEKSFQCSPFHRTNYSHPHLFLVYSRHQNNEKRLRNLYSYRRIGALEFTSLDIKMYRTHKAITNKLATNQLPFE